MIKQCNGIVASDEFENKIYFMKITAADLKLYMLAINDANWYLTKLLLILILQNQRLPMTQSVQPGLNNLLPVPLVRTAIALTNYLVYLNPSDLEKSISRPNFGNKMKVSDKSYVLAWSHLLVLFRCVRKLEIYDENEDNPTLPY